VISVCPFSTFGAGLVLPLTLWCPAALGDFQKKRPKRTWLCTGISPLL